MNRASSKCVSNSLPSRKNFNILIELVLHNCKFYVCLAGCPFFFFFSTFICVSCNNQMQQFHCYQFKRVSPILLKGKLKKNHSYLGGSIRIILSGKVFWRQRVKVFTYCLVWDLFQSLTLKVEHRIIKHQYCEAIRNNTERDFAHLGGPD